MGHHEHKKHSPVKVNMVIFSISSTRSIENDESGHWIKDKAVASGHQVILHKVIPDDTALIAEAVIDAVNDGRIQAILLTGGTGITAADVTIEALRPLFNKELPAFSSLFATLGYQEIGPAAMLSRATAGIVDGKVVFSMPGSLNACKLACNTLIFPELGHLVSHAQH